jgi:hypothetical protein
MYIFCRSLFVSLSLFPLAIVLSVLRFLDSDYPFGILKLLTIPTKRSMTFYVYINIKYTDCTIAIIVELKGGLNDVCTCIEYNWNMNIFVRAQHNLRLTGIANKLCLWFLHLGNQQQKKPKQTNKKQQKYHKTDKDNYIVYVCSWACNPMTCLLKNSENETDMTIIQPLFYKIACSPCTYIVHIMLRSSQEMIRLPQTRVLKLTYYQSSTVPTGCTDGGICIVLSYVNIQYINLF